MSFAVPQWDDLDLPSTPDRRSLNPIPSTTPIGPPPSATKSLFMKPNQQRNSPSNSNALFQAVPSTRKSLFGSTFGSPRAATAQGPARGRTSGFLPSSPPRGDSDERMMDDDEDPASLVQISPGIPTLASSFIGGPKDSMRGTKRPRAGTDVSPEKAKHDIRAYAKGLTLVNEKKVLDESDEFIIGTEAIFQALEAEEIDIKLEAQAQGAASQTAKELLRFWKSQHHMTKEAIEDPKLGAGPGAPDSATASLLASLFLSIRHPSAWESRSNAKTRHEQVSLHRLGAKSVPEVLLGWLAAFHRPGTDVVEAVLSSEADGYASDPQFWDAAISCLLTGRMSQVVEFLVQVDFRKSDIEYTNPQLEFIDQALELMIELLETCPGVKSHDWDVKGTPWGLFRREVRQVQEDLRALLEGKEGESENIDKSQLNFSLSRQSRMAESCLPQEIHDALYDMCEVLVGEQSIILNSCYDWIEGVMALTIWWDGEEEEDLRGSTRQNRRRQSRVVDVTPGLAYQRRLETSLQTILGENDLAASIDFSDPVQVAMCCIFESDTEEVVDILLTLSQAVASSVVQVAKLGGWLSKSTLEATTLLDLDQSDLMVLSYTPNTPPQSKKDSVLSGYAELLANREPLVDEDENATEGWELALMVLSRLDDSFLASKMASGLLKRIPLTSSEKVNKLLEICANYGFEDQALQVAEKFGDDLVGSRGSYGDALIYYAKSHNTQKMKELLHTLVTISIVQSRAYPPRNEVDQTLQQLLTSPQSAISQLNTSDVEAGWYLSTYLSGYATVRKFYELRDEDILLKKDEEPTDAKNRKLQGASALVAVITSAADSIHGGLLDPSVNVVIPVDTLFALLGESLAFLNQPRRILSFSQLNTILKVTEDLETVNPHVLERCETTLKAALADAHDSTPSSPQMLKKSISNMTSSSHFSMVGSSMFKSQILQKPGTGSSSASSSGVLVKGPVRRGWDWRTNLQKDTSSDVVLRILRLGLAKDIARGWIQMEN